MMVTTSCCKCGALIGVAATGQEARDMADLHRLYEHDELWEAR